MTTILQSRSSTSRLVQASQSASAKENVSTFSQGLDSADEVIFNEVDRLQDWGISTADIGKLKQAGLNTTLSVVQTCRKELMAIKGLSEQKIEKILEAATKIETGCGFMSGTQLLSRRSTVLRITTGSHQLDKILNGGVESMALTELFGENRSGKTQLCHTLCVTAQLPMEMNGGNGKVCFIDTEGTFRPEKVERIAERFGLAGDAVLNNVLYARAHTHEHLVQLILLAASKMVEDSFSLLIIDSIMALFRVDFSGRSELVERQQMLGKTLSRLQKISEQFNIAVVYTNHVMADPSNSYQGLPNQSKPIGGHVLGHASTHRLSLRLGKGDQRICKVYDSPNLPASDAVFQLSDAGVVDPLD